MQFGTGCSACTGPFDLPLFELCPFVAAERFVTLADRLAEPGCCCPRLEGVSLAGVPGQPVEDGADHGGVGRALGDQSGNSPAANPANASSRATNPRICSRWPSPSVKFPPLLTSRPALATVAGPMLWKWLFWIPIREPPNVGLPSLTSVASSISYAVN